MSAPPPPSQYDFFIRTQGPEGRNAIFTVEQAAYVFTRLKAKQLPESIAREICFQFGAYNLTPRAIETIAKGNFHIHTDQSDFNLSNEHRLPWQKVNEFWGLLERGETLLKAGIHFDAIYLLSANRFYVAGPEVSERHELVILRDANDDRSLVVSEALWLLQHRCQPAFVSDFVLWRKLQLLPVGDVVKLLEAARENHNHAFLSQAANKAQVIRGWTIDVHLAMAGQPTSVELRREFA